MGMLTKLKKDKYLAYIFLLPIIILLGSFTLFPISYATGISFFKWRLGGREISFVGTQNYLRVLTDPLFWTSLQNTIVFMIASVSLEMFLGFWIALLLYQGFKGARLIETAILIPMMVSPVVVGVMFMMMYHTDYGIINFLLRSVGFSGLPWLESPSLALWAIILADVWQQTPFVVLLLFAGLQALPTEPLEAAMVDGASRWQILRHITIPLLQKIIFVALTVRLIVSLRVFDKVWILTRGGPGSSTYVLNLLGYEKALRQFRIGESSALVILMLLITFGIVIFVFRKAFE